MYNLTALPMSNMPGLLLTTPTDTLASLAEKIMARETTITPVLI